MGRCRVGAPWRSSVSAIYHNTLVKDYGGGYQRYFIADKRIFRERGWEDEKETDDAEKKRKRGEQDEDAAGGLGEDDTKRQKKNEDSKERARRRARAAVRDLALANPDFKWFVTLTLDKEKIDRYDVAVITRKLRVWLDNQVRRRGLKYVLVPEHHGDGAIHFHGLFNDALEAVDSGHVDSKGHPVYNLPGWTLGFTAAIELYGDRDKAIGYISKYIGKESEKIGGRWYYSGGALAKPVQWCDDMDSMAVDAGTFDIDRLGARVKVFSVDGSGEVHC